MSDVKHIEVEGCIINIREGLHDAQGNKVTSIEILPDDHYAGEKVWVTKPSVHNIRVIQTKKVR
jgi:hypothetical protein